MPARWPEQVLKYRLSVAVYASGQQIPIPNNAFVLGCTGHCLHASPNVLIPSFETHLSLLTQADDGSLLRLRREPLLQDVDAERAVAEADSCQEPGAWQEQITFRAAGLGAVLVFITSTISLRGTLSNSGTWPYLMGSNHWVTSDLVLWCDQSCAPDRISWCHGYHCTAGNSAYKLIVSNYASSL